MGAELSETFVVLKNTHCTFNCLISSHFALFILIFISLSVFLQCWCWCLWCGWRDGIKRDRPSSCWSIQRTTCETTYSNTMRRAVERKTRYMHSLSIAAAAGHTQLFSAQNCSLQSSLFNKNILKSFILTSQMFTILIWAAWCSLKSWWLIFSIRFSSNADYKVTQFKLMQQFLLYLLVYVWDSQICIWAKLWFLHTQNTQICILSVWRLFYGFYELMIWTYSHRNHFAFLDFN